jgi:hypothetical protein
MTCTDFYNQFLPDTINDVSCAASDRRLAAEENIFSHHLRVLPMTTNTIPVDVTATFNRMLDAIGFDTTIVRLVNTRSQTFETLLQSTGGTNIQTYFRSVQIDAFDPTSVVPTLTGTNNMGMGMNGMKMNMGMGKATTTAVNSSTQVLTKSGMGGGMGMGAVKKTNTDARTRWNQLLQKGFWSK